MFAMMVSQETLSLLLGYTSIGFWLGAQFPQIVVNWRRKSVDGLALPFLANWLLGDSTNLLGCILTHQLPFQTYLATYFVFVDTCLVLQYFYYDAPKVAVGVLSSASSIIAPAQSRSRAQSLIIPHPPSSSRSATINTSGTNLAKLPSISSLSPVRRRAKSVDPLSESIAFSGVHSSLTQAHTTRAQTQGRVSSSFKPSKRNSQTSTEGSYRRDQVTIDDVGATAQPLVPEDDQETNDDLDSDSQMIASFYSEGGGRRAGTGKHVSWGRNETSRDRDHTHTLKRRQRSGSAGINPSYITEEDFTTSPTSIRGRPTTPRRVSDTSVESASASAYEDDPAEHVLGPTGGLDTTYPAQRFPSSRGDFSEADLDERLDSPPSARPHSRRRRTSSVSAISEATSRRSVSIVFLGAIVLLGFSRLNQTSPSNWQGNVLLPVETTQPPFNNFDPPHIFPRNLTLRASILDDHTRQLIGRISAWMCTTLYLTSRLPQIWKNYSRKSVEGLSMYLFSFAFFGNLFYVFSILTSPNMNLPPEESRHFLRESIPYLLGSGGTLLFDITIVSQSFIYTSDARRGRKRRVRTRTVGSVMSSTSGRMRRESGIESRRTLNDEERGLLEDEVS